MHRLRWTPYLTPGGREDAEQVREYPVRFTDIDLFDHMNNAVYWSVVEDYLSTRPELLGSPLRVTVEHEAPIALGDKLEILAHTHPAGSATSCCPERCTRWSGCNRATFFAPSSRTWALSPFASRTRREVPHDHPGRYCQATHHR